MCEALFWMDLHVMLSKDLVKCVDEMRVYLFIFGGERSIKKRKRKKGFRSGTYSSRYVSNYSERFSCE